MRVIVAGAGILGTQVLRDLTQAGQHEIVVVEAEEARARDLADEFDALVIHGDAADPDILDKAQIEQADALVATTGSDPINAVIAMLAHRKELGRIVVRLTSNSLRGALEEIGVTDIVAPTMAAAARIEAALHGTEEDHLFELIQGKLQVAELTVGPEADGSTVGDLRIPDGALLVAVVHGDDASLPTGDTELAEGDVVVAIAESEHALDRCRRAIERR